ncbi:NAD-dependent epimerase/dehydratase family protein [Litorilinea aerophila]|uniref:NAD-dependent epimerase/dehydratase family protein n=1 Tax=Litorilinea aerophila TaxID=1204385 RepID=A0A540VEC2_9CHLR|nr:NAD-dependent epimerase/dehydratase family protein [Litorilinea aerophila]MCC9077234.1 NAD-dependent epimerase/dehydratase family protein [Litorilinea aerophila]GIV78961.1 MAG: NAD-dependent epimerase [Litorilinea sp.]
MRKKAILITGASGEVGHALVKQLSQSGNHLLLTLDLQPLPPEIQGLSTHVQGDLLDTHLLARLVSEFDIEVIYHLAALLSTRSEVTPEMAHQINVEGTLGLLRLATEQSQWRNRSIQFIFPSSIAIYGMPDRESKQLYQRVREFEWNQPRTMYGCNKLYCEMLGIYYSRHYRQLAAQQPVTIDFRCVRFPGLISAFTLPSGGTSDYGPEMIHAAAKGEPYACFVRPEARIPFMAMPDAVHALLQLGQAPRERLTRLVYNVTSFSLSAGQIRERVLQAFPDAQITFAPDPKREAIIDSWPADLDDSAARVDWGWQPQYDVDRAFQEYLFPNIQARYRRSPQGGGN